MADTKYKLTLTGEQIDARLQLIEGDSNSVQINADDVSSTKGFLATQDYVNDCVDNIPSATESNDGLMSTAQVAKLNSIEEGATKIIITSGTEDLDDGVSKLASGTLYLVY